MSKFLEIKRDISIVVSLALSSMPDKFSKSSRKCALKGNEGALSKPGKWYKPLHIKPMIAHNKTLNTNKKDELLPPQKLEKN